MLGSASFHNARKFSYAERALRLSPDRAEDRPSCKRMNTVRGTPSPFRAAASRLLLAPDGLARRLREEMRQAGGRQPVRLRSVCCAYPRGLE